jgi:hypothetical protein
MSDDTRPADVAPGVPTESAQGDEFGEWFDREFADGPPADEAPVPDDATAASSPSFARRATARVLRRPVGWWQRPWSTERIVQVLVTSATLVTTTVVMMMVVHFNPLSPARDLIFDDTTPTGGDMGAHVWAPAFLRDHFLPNFQLSGWSMDWYGGLPLYRFYMVIPALAIVALDVLLPYGVAFKLVAVSGLLLFPLACWAFGRLAGFRHPIPELFSVAALCFLLDESFSIYGGNVKSTMAGEYSFSIALTLAMLGLGLLAHGLRTGRFRVWTAVVLSLAAVSHGIVLIFVAVSAVILCLVWLDRRRLVFAVTTGVTTLLLSAWWVGPFLFGHEFMTDMKYGFRPEGADDSFWDMFFPLAAPLDFIITALAVVGFVAMVLRRHLTGTAIGLICLTFVALVYLTRDSLPGIGLLWNPRLLPFVYLTRYLLMVIGALELLTWLVNAARDRRASTQLSAIEGAVAAGAITLSCLLVFGWMYETLPGGGRVSDGETSVYAWGPLRKGPESGRAVADGWTRYNMRGYEGRPKYPEYNELVTTMGDIGEERGCGRALWENSGDNGEYGTTMALMLLPHWTDGCIGSMEGLFFEASGTTPYHFLTAAAMSKQSSNPVRQLRYVNNDASVGVQHMHDLGVRYLMVRTPEAKAEAAAQERTASSSRRRDRGRSTSCAPRASSNRSRCSRSWSRRAAATNANATWRSARAGSSARRTGRRCRPTTARTRGSGCRSRSTSTPASASPTSAAATSTTSCPTEPIDVVELEPVTVSNVDIQQQSISFEVDQVGVPVLVRVSYFPTWKVEGADGPYRVAPNFMVVIPTDTEVTLSYSKTPLDWFFYSLTIARHRSVRLLAPPGRRRLPERTPDWRRPWHRPHETRWSGRPRRHVPPSTTTVPDDPVHAGSTRRRRRPPTDATGSLCVRSCLSSIHRQGVRHPRHRARSARR